MLEITRLVVSAAELGAYLGTKKPSDEVIVVVPFERVKSTEEMDAITERFVSASTCLRANRLTLVWVR